MRRDRLSLLTLLAAGAAPADEAVTLSGQRTTGRLVRVSADAVGLTRPGGAAVSVPARDLAVVEFGPGPGVATDSKYDEFELTDGSTFRAAAVVVKGTAVVADPLPAGSLKPPAVALPLRAVAWLLRAGHDPKNRVEFARVVAARGKRDLLVVRQAAGLQTVPCTVLGGTATGDRLNYEREDGVRAALPLARASGGLVFNQPPQADVPPTVCRVVDAFGNAWAAARIDLDGDTATVTTPAGAVVRYPDRAGLRTLDFGRGNVAYLSDLALDADYPPAEAAGPLGDQFPYAPRVVLDKLPRLGGRAFSRGLAVPPDAALVVTVGEGFRLFRATVGLPESAPPDAAFTLTVEADGRPLWDGPVKAGDPPRELSLNVADSKRLRLRVGRGRLWAGDALILGDARLQK